MYGLKNRPSQCTVKQIVEKCRWNGSVEDQRSEKYRRGDRSSENLVFLQVKLNNLKCPLQQVGFSDLASLRLRKSSGV